MFVFGGILEITKELNDMLVYDIASKSFHVLEQQAESDHQYHSKFEETQGPTLKVNQSQYNANNEHCQSPSKFKGGVSPSSKKHSSFSPSKKQ